MIDRLELTYELEDRGFQGDGAEIADVMLDTINELKIALDLTVDDVQEILTVVAEML